MKKLSLIALFLIVFFSAYSQTFKNEEANKIINGSDLVTLDENTKNIKHVCFTLSGSKQFGIQNDGDLLKEILALPSSYGLKKTTTVSDAFGMVEKYQFTNNGIDIKDFIFNIHKDESRISANGYYKTLSSVSSTPAIGEEEALNYAISFVGAKEYQWEIDPNFIKPAGTLFYLAKDNELILVYRFDIFSSLPMGRQYVYVNALNGNIELTEERIHIYTNASGTADTKYHGSKTITTDYNGGTYRLRENLRGNGIETYDLNNGTSYSSAVDFTDADNYWNTTTNQDNAAYDAHFGTEATYDFYNTKFGRNSIDGAGFALRSYVHYSSNYVNAFWNGSYMTYGDGDGYEFTALTCIDIVAHEITHGLTEHSANLNYSYESGALNESFSDILGTAIDFYANPTTANYLMGDQINTSGIPFRSMINPNLYEQPDTYLGSYWYTGSEDNGGVHYNSGVQNYWYYLLCEGGSGTNDNGNSFSVSAIGMEKATQIAYRTLVVYLTPTSQYADARYYSIQSAIDLFGECSPEVINVTNAWYAVGVGAAYSNAVIANFKVSQNYFCNFPATVQFTNQSVNGSTYLWNFGDGKSSTLANPTHTYEAPGSYIVSLTTTGTAACNSSNSYTSTTPIIVTNTGGPIDAKCTPASIYPTGSYGILNFTFNGISNTSPGTVDGYKDYTCQFSTTVTEGRNYSYSITIGTLSQSKIKMWIDFDNDGQFNETTELLVNEPNIAGTKSGIINIPKASVYDIPLRLRIASDYQSTTNLATSCTNSIEGQYEDYSIIILQNTQPPAVDFSASSTTVNTGQSISFTDLTQNLPTGWYWSFPGGIPSTSTNKNPTIVYNTVGLFPVKLKATNVYGQDSLIKSSYINVVDAYNMCSATSTTATNSVLYDSGGPDGSYKNSENCSFLIDPGCATSITLTFSSFYLESCCDYLTVYDGSNSSGTQLLRANGSILPKSVTASSGKMFITFTSDGSVTYPGFQATWSSIVPPSNPPVADFDISNSNPPFATFIEFTDQSTNSPTRWVWNFGDGDVSVEQNPQHSYSSSGVKTISLISFNCFGSDTSIQTIDVQQAPLLSVAPNSFNELITNCNDSITRTMVIKNRGLGDLEWSFPGFSNSVGDDFDPGLNTSFWKTITGGVAAATCDFFSAPNALYFNGSVREAITIPINTSIGGVLDFYLEISNGSSPCEKADVGENVVLSYSVDNGSSWVIINRYSPGSFNTFTNVKETIPERAKTKSTMFKWAQPAFSGAGSDNWSIDNVSISSSSEEFCHLSVSSGLIAPGDSSAIDIHINSERLSNNVYIDSINIFSNDPLKPLQKIGVSLTVDGMPEMVLSDTSIFYSDLFVGLNLTDTLKIINTGCDVLLINNITTSNNDFTLDKTAIDIAPGDTVSVGIRFSPSSSGTINSFLTIYSNVTDTVIYLSGYGIDPPVINISPERLSVLTYSCDDSITKHLTISNKGLSDLTIEFESKEERTIEMLALTYGVDYANEYKNTLAAINQYFTDYRLTEINTTSSSVLEVALRGKDVLLIAEQESGSASVFTSFAPVIQSFLNNGGKVIFCGTSNSSCILNTGIFSGSYAGDASSYTINVVNTKHPVNDSVSASFVSPNATFLFNFTNSDTTRLVRYGSYDVVTCRNFGKGKAIYVGFDYYVYNNDAARLIANAVKWNISEHIFPDWLSFSTLSDTIASNDSTIIDVTFNPEGLTNGVYSDSVSLYSNDPLVPVQKIACTFTVDGKPAISYSDTCAIFDGIFKGATITDTFLIINSGCDELLINNIISSNSDFTVKKSAMSIAPSDSALVPITFSPSSIGDVYGFLTLYSNINDTTMCLKGVGIAPPILNVVTASINTTINACNDSITRQLIVSNQGGSPLTIQIEGNRKKTIEMLALTYGVDYTSEYKNTLTAINQYFSDYHLTEINTTIASTLESALLKKDILLIAEQESGSASVYTSFAPVIQSFVNNGGKVIFCGTSNSSCIFNTGIFTGFYGGSLYPSTINVVNNRHFITDSVSASFISPEVTYAYNFNNSDTTRLVRYGSYDVVTCRNFGKGKAIYVGFDYFEYNNDAARIIANAVKWDISEHIISDWLSLSTHTDTIAPGSSATIDITFKTTDLIDGSYSDTLQIYTNDPLMPLAKVNCTMIIDGTPELTLSDTSVVFRNVYSGNEATSNFSILNTGCDTLLVSSISSSQPNFRVSTTSMNIAPGDSELVDITFTPNSVGTHNGYLSIFSNDVDTVLNLIGICIESPALFLSADTVHLNYTNESYDYISLVSDRSWTASSNQSWLTVTPQSGIGNHLLIFTAAGNEASTSRTAIVTVQLPNGQSETVTFIQRSANSNQVIKRTNQTIDIDGYIEDAWNIADKVPISLPFMNENPTVTATWSSLYDDNGLYVMVEVADDNHWPAWESGGDPWSYDRPELYWDVNEVLDDGLGAGYFNSGHYMLSDGFTDGMYDTQITKTPGGNHPGGTYCYTMDGEGYFYEHFVPFANLKDQNGVAINSSTTRPIGFDVTITDQDEGVTTTRQRCVWSNDGNGNNGSSDESWNNMDGAGTITLGEYLPRTPLNETITNVSYTNTNNICSDAVNTITIAGGGSSVSFQSGSSVELIAGNNIRFLPGFHAFEGSFARAWITTDGTFCDWSSGSIVENPQQEKSGEIEPFAAKDNSIEKSIMVYPNPNNGKFTIKLENIDPGADIIISDILGSNIFQSKSTDLGYVEVSLLRAKRGLYFIRVIDKKNYLIRKILVK